MKIVLLYIEYLNKKYTNKYNPDTHLKSGSVPELKRIAKQFIISIGVLSSGITLKNEYMQQETTASIKEKARAIGDKAAEEAKKTESDSTAKNFINRLNLTNISQSQTILDETAKEESEIRKAIKERRVQWETDGDKTHLDKIKTDEIRLEGVELKNKEPYLSLDNLLTEQNYFIMVFLKKLMITNV